MDSCNSGSIQSSSCGDDEYDSRAHASNKNISSATFLNNPSRNHVVDVGVGPFTTTNNHNLNPHTSPPSQQQQQQNHTHMFDPSLSNYLDSIQKSPNPFLNLDMLWSKPPRSEPNITDLGGLMLPSSSSQQSQQQNQAFLLSQLSGQSQTRGVSVSSALPPESSSRGANNDQLVSNNNNVRNTKKRSRASRRAPTTVLTTDTTNFRAMVQEFTGIPAPPFTSSPFPRTRLDLFGSSTTRSTFDPSSQTPPSYLLRPFAQKLQPPPSHNPFQPSSSSMVENLASNNHHNPSYNLSSSTSQADHHLGLFNMHNSILGFQGPPKYQPAGNSSSVLVSKTQPSLEISPGTVDSHMKMNVLEELGLSHTHSNIGSLHQNMVSGTSSDGGTLMSRLNNNNNSTMEWAQRTVSTIADNDRGILGSPVNYRSDNIIQERVSNAKVVNYTASSSGPECAVVARGEGTVESWINCSSSD